MAQPNRTSFAPCMLPLVLNVEHKDRPDQPTPFLIVGATYEPDRGEGEVVVILPSGMTAGLSQLPQHGVLRVLGVGSPPQSAPAPLLIPQGVPR